MYAFIDVETGGLHADESPVLELACVITDDDFTIVEEFCTLVRTN